MLALKLSLVPGFLLLISLAGRRWGPSTAGWLAGLPVVTGPILFFLAFAHGDVFASHAASAALSAVFASIVFCAAYAHCAQRMAWVPSLLVALSMWAVAAFGLSQMPDSLPLSLAVSCCALASAPRLFPVAQSYLGPSTVTHIELGLRMVAGALLTVAVTLAAKTVGTAWSGLLAVFPILAPVLAVFAHRTHGPAYVATLLRSMAVGLYAFAAFCFSLALALPRLGTAAAFLAAAAAALAVQAATKKYLRNNGNFDAARRHRHNAAR